MTENEMWYVVWGGSTQSNINTSGARNQVTIHIEFCLNLYLGALCFFHLLPFKISFLRELYLLHHYY